ncbi:MAG: hypothetical protein HY896_08540 [Deltaproteobacteria bacterium]|nr:hypothetical protein [Deltaproteobacteria bacterium]
MKRYRRVLARTAFLFMWMAFLIPSANAAPPPEWLPGFPLRAGTIVVLRWAPVPGATSYKVYKKTGKADFAAVYSGPQTIFNDPNVSPAETVSYKVTATVEGKESPSSPPAVLRGLEPLKPPAFFGATYPPGAITLRWSTPPGTIFFNLYRAEGRGMPFHLLDSTHQDIYTDRSVRRGISYYYKITAVDSNNLESEASAPFEARLPAEVAAPVKEKPILRKVAPTGEFFGEEFYPFVQPSEMGFLSSGELYVLDRTSIQFFEPDGTYLSRVNLDRKWDPPSGIAMDRDGKFLVAFYSDNTIRKLDDEGKGIEEIKYPPTDTGIPNNPNNLAVTPEGFCWIADGSRFQVIKADRAREKYETIGRLRGTYDRRDKTEADLPTLTRIQFNPYDGKLYAVLGVTVEIKVIDPKTSRVVKTFGGLGLENAKFQGIGGLAFRKNGNVLVLDHLMQVIKEFDRDYKYVATYADVVERDIVRLSSNVPTTFVFREAIRRFYISSGLGNRVYKFDIAEAESPPGKSETRKTK